MKDVDTTIFENIGLIKTCLFKFKLHRDPEAESIAYEALHKAILDYDETTNYKLSTLATVYIRNALGTYLRTITKQRQISTVSYNSIAYSEDGINHEFLELLSCSDNPEDGFIRQEFYQATMVAFTAVLETLPPRKRQIVEVWRDSEYEATNKAIAKEVGVSQPYVNQVLNVFRHELRKRLEEYSDE